MIKNKPLIEQTIKIREEMNDPVLKFATRNKASPPEIFGRFNTYSKEAFKSIYFLSIDAVKLQFKYVTLIINGRHNN